MCLAGGVVSESATADLAANGPPGAISIAGRLMSRRLTTSLTGSRRPEILAGVVRKRCGLTCAQVVERDGGKLREASCEPPAHQPRSEEHTSELQSHVNLVCRL